MKEDPRKRGAARIPSRGPELLGGVLFLIGCLPAVALIKALRDGTDLSSAGLGGTAALAARVETWVGTWPGLMISGAIAAFGAMAVLGALRSDLMRRMVGIVVCGLGVAAISSALAVGSGGRIGDGTGARLADAVGPWAGILVGAGIVAVALWLAFAEAPREGSRTLEVSLDGPELRRASAERSGPAVQELSPPSRGGQSSNRPASRAPASRAPGSRAPGSGSSAPRGAGGKARGGEAAGGSEEPSGAASRRPKPSQATGDRPAASGGVAPEAASEAVTPTRPRAERVSAADAASPASTGAGMPLLDREADPVVDGPSPSAHAGGFSVAAIPSWLGGLMGAVSGRLMSRRPRVAMPAPKKSEPKTLGDALVRGEAEGVSHDEAAALAPDGNTLAYMEEVWRDASASLQQVEPIPPSPYPDDPRLKGEIPQGTTPLGGAAVAGPAPPAAEVVSPASPVPPAALATPIGDVAPFDLVDDEESLGMGGEGDLAPGSVGDGAAASEASVTDLPSGVVPLETDVDELSLPRPPASWEGGFEEDTVSEADGTWTRGGTAEDPAESAVESSVESRTEDPAASTSGPGSGDEPKGGALAHGEEAQAADSPEGSPEGSPEDSLEGEAPVDEAPVDEETVDEETADEETAGEISADEDQPEEDSDEYEYVDEDGNPIDIDALEDGDYELVDEDDYEAAELEEDLDEDLEEDEEEEEGDEEEAGEEEEEEEEAEYEEAEYEEAAEDESPQEDPAEDPEEDLEEDEAAAELEDADPDEYEEAVEEEGIILEPQSPPSGASADSERLLKAGRVLVRQGRVAVSVLQQELDMEFDEACQLLDQLQAEGLIGPYKGGKKRDILLSEEEWEDHFAHS